ncbi:anti-phage dCTP deaminase [Psychrobacter sanguinis]|uniref:anti-phage dCTP deaminase n=1 Tax=Psychrobacter sanguinis TaxID=861445 RepID=UPI0028AFCCC4|nr:anti-phage dCTP deaminase [Psychrobacter sanguinis]
MSEKYISTIGYVDYKTQEWGYIEKVDPNSEKDFFFSVDSLVDVDIRSLSKGIQVSFEIKEDTKVPIATNIHIINTNQIPTKSTSNSDTSFSDEIGIPPSSIANKPNDDLGKTQQNFDNSDPLAYLRPKGQLTNSELVIGIVSSVGIDSSRVTQPLVERFNLMGYKHKTIKVSSLLNKNGLPAEPNENERIAHYIKEGNRLRKSSNNTSILAAGAIKKIRELRDNKVPNVVYIVDSLKHPSEVELFRKTYGEGFYLIGIQADKSTRRQHLVERKGCNGTDADTLIETDENENQDFGQKTRDTFHLSDFFINLGRDQTRVFKTVYRFVDLILSHPHKHPTFDEFAMFMAFNSSVRSGDLSRQVGAVLTRNQQILATGANDVPKAHGGLYWAYEDAESGDIIDCKNGKDYMCEGDPNKKMQLTIVDEILATLTNVEGMQLSKDQAKSLKHKLRETKIGDLTEFGRVVHAEMEAILSCSREGIATSKSTLYCTTFPCHNCAKHIIASGIERVVYIEPYPKSLALTFHSDSIEIKDSNTNSVSNKVIFESFIGVGPRRFLDLFSMSLGKGNKLRRKDKDGEIEQWPGENIIVRTPLPKKSYLEFETDAQEIWDSFDRSKS